MTSKGSRAARRRSGRLEEPPGLTVAVAKERAVESFLLKGSNFNLNVLQAGNEKDTMKALLKPFQPGENRFGDMEVEISERNGCAIVTEALSYLECEVTERMECGPLGGAGDGEGRQAAEGGRADRHPPQEDRDLVLSSTAAAAFLSINQCKCKSNRQLENSRLNCQ